MQLRVLNLGCLTYRCSRHSCHGALVLRCSPEQPPLRRLSRQARLLRCPWLEAASGGAFWRFFFSHGLQRKHAPSDNLRGTQLCFLAPSKIWFVYGLQSNVSRPAPSPPSGRSPTGECAPPRIDNVLNSQDPAS